MLPPSPFGLRPPRPLDLRAELLDVFDAPFDAPFCERPPELLFLDPPLLGADLDDPPLFAFFELPLPVGLLEEDLPDDFGDGRLLAIEGRVLGLTGNAGSGTGSMCCQPLSGSAGRT